MKLPAGFVPGLGVHKPTAKGGLGEQLLKRMGWSEGKGLGRNEDGMADAITVKKKEDQTGVGAGAHAALQWENKWWEDAYNSGAAKVQQDASSSSSDSDSDDSTDTEVPASKRQRLHRDGTVSSATAAERSIAAALAADKWGRFGGREGKMARIRAQEQAAAAARKSASCDSMASRKEPMLVAPKQRRSKAVGRGISPAPPDAPQAAPASTAPSSKKKKISAKITAGAAAAAAATAAEAAMEADDSSRALPASMAIVGGSGGFVATPAVGWWGASRFMSSGCLAGLERTAEHAAKERRAFSEATQEQLYMAVHGAKTTGKKGVGKGAGGGILGGAKWEGSRVTFDGAAEGAAPAGSPAGEAAEAVDLSGLAEQLEGVKWKKMVMAALQQAAKGSMSRKKLRKVVLAQVAAKHSLDPQLPQLRRIFDERLYASSKFIVAGSVVTLKA